MTADASARRFPWPVVLFDLDGTLVDTASDIAASVNRLLVELGHPPVDEATVRSWIGDGAGQLVGQALRHAGDGRDVATVMPRFLEHYRDCLLLDPALYPGVERTLQALQADGVRMAVCTNKPVPFVAPLLDAMGITPYFEAVLGAGELPERKPDPAPLLHLADRFDVPIASCLMVGDSSADAGAAIAAGAPLVMVGYGYRRSFDLHGCGALAVIDRFEQLLELR
ncbi:phosphoglycolate phosphatase [Luteimonas deserti]|uniref:Phosphoglycolate phosphatase n=1 Tax=Luteimonas deserti TaxID=2752306 RepID=A0A7Z0TZF9_9GAMM|nr:phosphoglycolate phosphatase [Luteimonas deserti]NYZ63397.1 phosphoglycolate phosphatase [Luteimonas deserti]